MALRRTLGRRQPTTHPQINHQLHQTHSRTNSLLPKRSSNHITETRLYQTVLPSKIAPELPHRECDPDLQGCQKCQSHDYHNIQIVAAWEREEDGDRGSKEEGQLYRDGALLRPEGQRWIGPYNPIGDNYSIPIGRVSTYDVAQEHLD